jgi:hypothetical protein
MSSTKPYELVTFRDAKTSYRTLTEAYWNWIYEPDCDKKSDKGYVTFMRDDSIGGPRKPGVKSAPYKDTIDRPEGTNIFFPVYQVHICERDPHPDRTPCGIIDRCVEAAYDDLSKINIKKDGNQDIWADISINGAARVPITTDFRKHDVTLVPITLKVGPNNLNREPDYHLEPGVYDGVVRGTYMYLKNFKKGTYVLYFGGTASNFETSSEYTMNVT